MTAPLHEAQPVNLARSLCFCNTAAPVSQGSARMGLLRRRHDEPRAAAARRACAPADGTYADVDLLASVGRGMMPVSARRNRRAPGQIPSHDLADDSPGGATRLLKRGPLHQRWPAICSFMSKPRLPAFTSGHRQPRGYRCPQMRMPSRRSFLRRAARSRWRSQSGGANPAAVCCRAERFQHGRVGASGSGHADARLGGIGPANSS